MIYQLLAKWLVSWTPIFYLKGVLGGSSHFVSSQDHPPHLEAIKGGHLETEHCPMLRGQKLTMVDLTTCPSFLGWSKQFTFGYLLNFGMSSEPLLGGSPRSPQLGDLQSPWLLLTKWDDPPSRWHGSDIFCLPQPPVARFHGILTSWNPFWKKKQVVMNARITRGHQLLCC